MEVEFAFFAVPDEAALGGEDDLVAAIAEGLADDFFRLAEAIHRGGIDQSYSVVQSGMDGVNGEIPIGTAPHPAAYRPGPKTDYRCVDTR